MTRLTTLLCSGLLLAGLVTALPGQSLSSKNWFVSGSETSSGGNAASSTWRMNASLGSGATAGAARSKNFGLTGGFTATLDAKTTGRPWLSATRPLFTLLDGGSKHSVHGTELDLGPSSTVKVNGVTATVTSRARDVVEFVAPAQKAPGWHTVTLGNSGGTASLSRAIGVLPLIEQATPYFEPGKAGNDYAKIGGVLRYRGQHRDSLVWLFSVNKMANFPVIPFRHGLEVSLFGIAFSIAVGGVNSPDGLSELPLPLVRLPGRIYVQAASISSKPGYAPGSFTNMLPIN